MSYPVMLSLKGKKCLVAGAGSVAESKTRRLLMEGANVTVVSPEATPYFRGNSGIKYIKRRFKSADLNGKFLIIAATGDEGQNSEICRMAAEKNILANNVSGREHASFMNMAFVCKNGLVLAVSSNGRNVKKSLDKLREIRRKIP